jgi:hypothetical protein
MHFRVHLGIIRRNSLAHDLVFSTTTFQPPPSTTLSHLYTPCAATLRLTQKMAMRSVFGRQATKAIRPQQAVPGTRRGLAAPASGSFAYQQGDAAGIKFASRDMAGPTTTLAVVARAGTRYQPLPGLAEGLEKFAFRVCASRESQLVMKSR